jgi:hypothetical protein
MFSGASPLLAHLAPLPMFDPTAGVTQQLAVRPLEQIQPVSAHPELIAAGIGQGIESIGKGVVSGLMENRKEKREKAKAAADAQLQDLKFQREDLRDARSFAMDKARLGLDQERLAIERERTELLVRGKGSLPPNYFGDNTAETPSGTVSPSAGETMPLEQLSPVPGQHRDFTTPLNSEEDALQMGIPDIGVGQGSSPLGDLTTPVNPIAMDVLGPGMQMPTPNLQESGAGFPSAGTNLSGIPPLSSTPAVLQKARGFGAESIPAQYAIEKQLYGMSQPAQAASPTPSQGSPAVHAFRTEEQAYQEANRNIPGWDLGTVKGEKIINPSTGQPMMAYRVERSRAKPEKTTAENAYQREKDLRTEFTAASKGYETLLTANTIIEKADKNPTAASDMALIFSYMKLLDPNSAVKEGEYATAQNAASIPQKIIAQYNKAISGPFLDVDQRKAFIDTAKSIYGDSEKKQRGLIDRIKSYAIRHNIDPEDLQTLVTPVPETAAAKTETPSGDESKIQWYVTKISDIKNKRDAARAKGDEQSAKTYEAQMVKYGSTAAELRKLLDNMKSDGM